MHTSYVEINARYGRKKAMLHMMWKPDGGLRTHIASVICKRVIADPCAKAICAYTQCVGEISRWRALKYAVLWRPCWHWGAQF